MNIRYKNTFEDVDWGQVSKIFEVIGWGARPPEKIEAAFQQSSFMRFAYIDDQLVGMGRTVDDGLYYAWVVDLAVLPEHQGMGIGTYILNELEKDLESFISTMLTAVPGKSGFYEKLGWLKQSAAYIWPRSEKQKHEFTSHR
jgi:aralkylamine N-acetyltransferase